MPNICSIISIKRLKTQLFDEMHIFLTFNSKKTDFIDEMHKKYLLKTNILA